MKQYCDGGEAILEAFRSLGLDYIISSPGSEWSPVWEALARQKVNQQSGPKVERPAELPGAIRSAMRAVEDGKTAILNVVLSR